MERLFKLKYREVLLNDRQRLRLMEELVDSRDTDGIRGLLKDKRVKPEFFNDSYHVVARAAERGYLDVVKTLRSVGFSVDNKNYCDRFKSPICMAFRGGHVDIVKFLVEDCGVSMESDDYTSPPVEDAVVRGRLEVVKYFVESGISMEDVIRRATSLLHNTVRYQHASICHYLLSKGANANQPDRYIEDQTPLFVALFSKKDVFVRNLISAGADVNYRNRLGQTPMFQVLTYGPYEFDGYPPLPETVQQLDMVKLLASFGADPDIQDMRQGYPLATAIHKDYYNIARYLLVELNAQLLIKKIKGMPILIPHAEGKTIFYEALEKGRYDMVDLMVGVGYRPVREVHAYTDVVDKQSPPSQDKDNGRKSGCFRRQKLEELRYIVCNPWRLETLCTFTIRQMLGRRVAGAVPCLPLPERMKNILMLRHIKERNDV